ncbi:hypothetical protein TL16_g07964 [Triparma laevis f. inornata]|uniref:Uncharacterized protein n=1 Tax=Triparma laevis f. inornata TaxID=1714386 RepID=A0A9W7ATK4_9STRA|nr:hypothetical protein TL16_g07964 [Triparma laevis f. inornata]
MSSRELIKILKSQPDSANLKNANLKRIADLANSPAWVETATSPANLSSTIHLMYLLTKSGHTQNPLLNHLNSHSQTFLLRKHASTHDISQLLTVIRLKRRNLNRITSSIPLKFFRTAQLSQLTNAFHCLTLNHFKLNGIKTTSKDHLLRYLTSSSPHLLHLLSTTPPSPELTHQLSTLLWSFEKITSGKSTHERRFLLNPFIDLIPEKIKGNYKNVRDFRMICLGVSKVSPFRVDVMGSWGDDWGRIIEQGDIRDLKDIIYSSQKFNSIPRLLLLQIDSSSPQLITTNRGNDICIIFWSLSKLGYFSSPLAMEIDNNELWRNVDSRGILNLLEVFIEWDERCVGLGEFVNHSFKLFRGDVNNLSRVAECMADMKQSLRNWTRHLHDTEVLRELMSCEDVSDLALFIVSMERLGENMEHLKGLLGEEELLGLQGECERLREEADRKGGAVKRDNGMFNGWL